MNVSSEMGLTTSALVLVNVFENECLSTKFENECFIRNGIDYFLNILTNVHNKFVFSLNLKMNVSSEMG